jgi:glycosyltransferase involved in cell wall biosynthesis
MNALIVSEPGASGVFAYVEALCHFLIGEGVRVHLAYSDRRGSDRLLALVRFVESNGGLTLNLGVGSGAGPGDIRAFHRLRRLALRAQPDVVHCHSSKAGVLGRSLALAGIRASYFYHPHAYYGMRPRRGTLDFAYDGAEALLGRIGTTITVSADERNFAANRLRIPPRRLRTIPNGVDTDRFRPAAKGERLALRKAFGIPRDGIILGAISRLSLQKDPATLYRAFAAASRTRADLYLFHVGSGELEHEVDELARELGIRDRLIRLGYLADPTGFYQSVDGLILTSTYEGLSLAALEALSSDLPLILSRAPGNNDLLELPLSHAWSAAPGDVDGFATSIELWHACHSSRRTPNHRAIAMERFDFRAAHAAVLGQYREAVGASAGAMGAWSARLPALVWIGVIMCESTDRLSRANTRRLLYPPFHIATGVSYEDFFEWNVVLRKVGHVVLYGILSLLLYRLARFETRRSRPRGWSIPCAAFAILGTVLAAALDEWHQTTIPSRTGTVADVMLDASAGLAAQLLILFASTPFGPRRPLSDLEPGFPGNGDP